MLIFLAPFGVIGGIIIVKFIYGLSRRSWSKKQDIISIKYLAIFFAIFLLFNSTWINVITNEGSPLISLQKASDDVVFNNKEINAATFIDNYTNTKNIFADSYRYLIFGDFNIYSNVLTIQNNKFVQIPKNSYIFLGTFNIVNGEVLYQNVNGSRILFTTNF